MRCVHASEHAFDLSWTTGAKKVLRDREIQDIGVSVCTCCLVRMYLGIPGLNVPLFFSLSKPRKWATISRC
jgi:hypothetical protein